MAFTLKIENINIVPYIFRGGVKWQREDIDGEGTGRTISGELQRNRIATKIRLDITCKPLTTDEAQRILSLIAEEVVNVTYTDPQAGERSVKMYSNNNPATVGLVQADGTIYWTGITFPLIEV